MYLNLLNIYISTSMHYLTDLTFNLYSTQKILKFL